MELNYTYKELKTIKYKQTNIITGKTEIVIVTNQNNLTTQEHLKLLNLNSEIYQYSEI